MDAVVKAEIRISFEDTKKYAILLKKHQIKTTKRKATTLDVLKFLYGMLWPALIMLVVYLFSFLKRDIDVLSINIFCCVYLFAGLFSYFGKRIGLFIDEEFWARVRRVEELDADFYDEVFEINNSSYDLIGLYSYSDCSSGAEWKDAFYLHAANDKEIIIPKSSITEGTPEALSMLLRDKLGDRFIPQKTY